MLSKPLITIMTPVYNGAAYMEELIVSVRDQDYPNVEHLIIDDGSTDHGATLEILRKHPHLRWWSRPNQGQYATMNEGLRAAQGELICFLSVDDMLVPDAITRVVDLYLARPTVDVIYGKVLFVDGQGEPYPMAFRQTPLWSYQYFAHISHSSLYVRRSVLISRGLLFCADYKYVADYEWIIRLIENKLEFCFLNESLSKIRKHDEQLTARFHAVMKTERERVLKAHSINRVTIALFTLVDLIISSFSTLFSLRKTGTRGLKLTLQRWYHKYWPR
jgi:glycosyltransferase involved in cell wall biosynthesis